MENISRLPVGKEKEKNTSLVKTLIDVFSSKRKLAKLIAR